MSIKAGLLLGLIAILFAFIYLKVQVNGSPNSHFNQTTRFSLGRHPYARLILGLHDYGDARAEYLSGTGPIKIEWFRPKLEDIDMTVLDRFAASVKEYTGRPTQVEYGGDISDTIVNKNTDLEVSRFFGQTVGASTIYVFFSEDYTPKVDKELSTTLKESGILISLNAHREFLQSYSGKLSDYLLSSLLHEFGHQLGLEHNSDSDCLMYAHAGLDGQPMEYYGQFTPKDFCPAEQQQIINMKLKYQTN